MVGVSGVRGLIGETLTPAVAVEFAQAYGTLLRGGRLVVARDTRPSGEMYAALIGAGLAAAGCRVTHLGVAMTPTVGLAITQGKFDGGAIVTASHNPAPWNGIKFLDERGLAPDPARAAEIARIRDGRAFELIRAGFAPFEVDDQAGERHVEAVLAAVEVDLAPLRGLKVVLDSVNGAGCADTPGMLTQMGCQVVHLNGEPTGDFAHTPEPTAENLTQLCEAVRSLGAAVGFAQDPDADRLALVDEHGAYIGEEYTLALATQSVVMRRRGAIAANLSTSRMVDVIADRYGCPPVVRTAVGEANVARGMIAAGAVIGGEGNGGVIDPRLCYVRDSLASISLVLQLMAATGKTLSQLVADLPRYALVKTKMECAAREQIATATARVAAAFAGEKLNTSDGTRVDFAEGWVHLRGSNTEPIMRLMAEAEDEATARALIERVRKAAGL